MKDLVPPKTLLSIVVAAAEDYAVAIQIGGFGDDVVDRVCGIRRRGERDIQRLDGFGCLRQSRAVEFRCRGGDFSGMSVSAELSAAARAAIVVANFRIAALREPLYLLVSVSERSSPTVSPASWASLIASMACRWR